MPLVRKGGRQHFVLSQPAWSQQKYRVVSKLLLSESNVMKLMQVGDGPGLSLGSQSGLRD